VSTVAAATRRGPRLGIRGPVLHPLAWWAWAGGAIVAITRAANPLTIALLTGAVVFVVIRRRSNAAWTGVFRIYLIIAAAVVVLRMVFYVLFGIRTGGPVLLPLPAVPLPDWAGGISLLGPLEVPGLLSAFYQALGLAAIIVCFGAANALANPKHVLRHLPGALHDLGTAVVIAVTVTPQLITSARNVARARRLRGVQTKGPRAALGYVRPVLHEAMERAIALAASMDARGYARASAGSSRAVSIALLVAVALAGLGTYGLLDAATPGWLGLPVLVLAVVVGAVAIASASVRVQRSRYWVTPWGARETGSTACAALAAAVVVAGGDHAFADPMQWPGPEPVALIAVVLLLVPMVLGRGGS